jgi:hypothetical protein
MFKKFADFFVESDEPSNQPIIEQKIEKKVEPEIVKPVQHTISIPGQSDPSILEIINQSIQAANIPGFDYLEFKDALVKMESIPMPEQQKYQAVFAVAQSVSATKDSIINSITTYLDVIDKKKVEFEQFINSNVISKISKKKELVSNIDAEIQQAALEIERITSLIKEKQERKNTLLSEISQEEIELKSKQDAFNNTTANVINNLLSEKAKIENYLK